MPSSYALTLDDLSNAKISPKDYMSLWDSYATAVLKASVSFHGAHSSLAGSGAKFAAQVADQMMALRLQRMEGLLTSLDDEDDAKTKGKK